VPQFGLADRSFTDVLGVELAHVAAGLDPLERDLLQTARNG
jgi:hypothetical protein